MGELLFPPNNFRRVWVRRSWIGGVLLLRLCEGMRASSLGLPRVRFASHVFIFSDLDALVLDLLDGDAGDAIQGVWVRFGEWMDQSDESDSCVLFPSISCSFPMFGVRLSIWMGKVCGLSSRMRSSASAVASSPCPEVEDDL